MIFKKANLKTNILKLLKSNEYNRTELKRRHLMVKPLKHANLKYSEVRRMGFKVSRPLWNSCNNSEDRNLGTVLKINYSFFRYLSL